MYMDFNLNLSQEQKLIMTQQMQLSIKLLQMSTYDLKEYIEKEFSENPVLEAQFNIENKNEKEKSLTDYKELVKYLEFDNYSSQSYSDYKENDITPFTFISNEISLKEYLHEQISELKVDDYLRTVCDYIIENIDSRGYLASDLEEIAKEINTTSEFVNEGLNIIQDLEPLGIGARDLKECLLIQLKNKDLLNDITKTIINKHLEDLADNKYQVIAKKLKITTKEAQHYGDIIKTLEPKPSRGYYTGDEVKFIIPDAEIRNIDGEFFIIMSDSLLPKLSINPMYKEILTSEDDKNATSYVKEKIGKAMFLIKSIEQRRGTLYRVLEKILSRQREYFEKGIRYLRPMTIKEIAEDISMHESTVSRAIREKYILTSFGTIKIRDLFTLGVQGSCNKESDENIAVVNIKKAIEDIISNENKQKPLSDQNISELLEENGIHISRRTVAKYREDMGIKSSSKRKRF